MKDSCTAVLEAAKHLHEAARRLEATSSIGIEVASRQYGQAAAHAVRCKTID